MTNTQKRELAEKLYTSNFFPTQRELAKYVDVSEVTLSTWAKKYKWDDLKESWLASQGEQLSFLYRQLRFLKEELEESGRKTYNSKEVDIVIKLTAAIKNLKSEKGLDDIIDVMMTVTEWLRTVDLKKAQEVSDIFNMYIKANS